MYASGDQIKTNELGGPCSTYGERRGAYGVFVGKPEGRRLLERPRRRWKNNIKMDLYEVGCEGMDWIDLAQDRDRRRTLVNGVMNLRVSEKGLCPMKSVIYLKIYAKQCTSLSSL
jgi:hypothetical protein